jgi:hypothetical protein
VELFPSVQERIFLGHKNPMVWVDLAVGVAVRGFMFLDEALSSYQTADRFVLENKMALVLLTKM